MWCSSLAHSVPSFDGWVFLKKKLTVFIRIIQTVRMQNVPKNLDFLPSDTL